MAVTSLPDGRNRVLDSSQRLERGTVAQVNALEVEASAQGRKELGAPARTALIPLPDKLSSRAQSRTDVAAEGSSLVLLIENDSEMNLAIQSALSSRYHVESASDGAEGLKIARELLPDLIVAETVMPGTAGEQLIQELRQSPELESVPIIMLTASADDALRWKLIQSGAQDYVIKPFSLAELSARIGNLVAIKHARDVLEAELHSRGKDLASLASEFAARKRELQESLSSIRVAREQAETAAETKGRFLRVVSHELRTPLTALQLQLQRLQRDRDGPLTPNQRVTLQKMSAFTNQLISLFESLLHCARIEAGGLASSMESFDLLALAAEVVEEVRVQAEEKGLLVQLMAPPDLPALESDQQLVRLIISNLLSNAIKFTEQGVVRLELNGSGETHQIRVADTGPGIAREDQNRVFDPFERLSRPHQKRLPGAGLGLALVKEMVIALGGEVRLESELGCGSTFTVIIPSRKAKDARQSKLRTDDANPDRRK